jgi:hypothetical protein
LSKNYLEPNLFEYVLPFSHGSLRITFFLKNGRFIDISPYRYSYTPSQKHGNFASMSAMDELKGLVNAAVADQLPEQVDNEEALLQWLTEKIEHLIQHDFDGLLFLLYRIDVSENRVREMLAATAGASAARTIAELILERQKQKLIWRAKFRQHPTTPGEEEERW